MSDPEYQDNCLRDSLRDQEKRKEADGIAIRSRVNSPCPVLGEGIVDRGKSVSKDTRPEVLVWTGEASPDMRYQD